MKELTHKEWTKNLIPRMVWVWDDDGDKEKIGTLAEIKPNKGI